MSSAVKGAVVAVKIHVLILPEQAEKLQQLYPLMELLKKSDIVTIALNDLLPDEERIKTIIEKAKVIRRIK